MNIPSEYLLGAVIIFLWLTLYVMIGTLLNKVRVRINLENLKADLRQLPQIFAPTYEQNPRKMRSLLMHLLYLTQNVKISPIQKQQVFNATAVHYFERTQLHQLKSNNRFKRMSAARYLSSINTDNARRAIESALLKEKHFATKLYLANALADINDPRSIAVLIKSLYGAHYWYRNKVNMMIAGYRDVVREFIQGYFWSSDIEIRELLVDLAGTIPSEEFRDYLIDILHRGPSEIKTLKQLTTNLPAKCCYYCTNGRLAADETHRQCPYKGKVENSFRCRKYRTLVTSLSPASNYHRLMLRAAETLEKFYPEVLLSEYYLEHADRDIQSIAVRALGHVAKIDNFQKLILYLEREETANAAREGLRNLLNNHPNYTPRMIEQFTISKGILHQRLAEVLSHRIEYVITKLLSDEHDFAAGVIDELISMDRVSEIIEFLKRNKNAELETRLIEIIQRHLTDSELLERECGLFLPERILNRLGIARLSPPTKKREEKLDKKLVHILWIVIIFAVGIFPTIYLIKNYDKLGTMSFLQNIKYFVLSFNVSFSYYAITINFTYLFLLFFSRLNIRREAQLWELKSPNMLFKPRMLPSVSIIAPAYNEETTIIESANSLLNLKYPDYELVIVNDGSRDETLKTLIDHFDLKKTDFSFQQRLKHYPIRGIYTNPAIPRLIVVDKENGGKADTLNAGINVSSKEYFCGIDADSLLESDALLKIAALTLDYGVETPALGGNVFPINGCTVDKGKIERINVPKHWLARLQTVEYMRAFMCGRLGWDYLNSLLIISGAFGLFRKERVIAIGGYLTSSSQYQRDTVGEDMELVVRIARHMREMKHSYRISYAFNANCWTEVPEKMSSLQKQRNRWQRGLIDIMTFHHKLIFNPSYGTMGLIAMPYYLIFEMVGPLFEIQGYLMVFVAALFGMLSVRLAILLFFASVLMGIFISVASVKIAERLNIYFGYLDTLKLIGIAILENFGPRQLFSAWRTIGFLKAMQKPQGWQKFERKGFEVKKEKSSPRGAIHQRGKTKK